ncbi:hypothetical protein K1T71_011448 [Dendrolimus kikuchii]|uniref:Uncharacterized protein n=1 Tax=Dendrolimus kikuchii TaxID=765133 RepID=A0ACC1CP74_9NEOP|nr:hypothetical protein K1T71_011448 [Dendrolimus kikuchii]
MIRAVSTLLLLAWAVPSHEQQNTPPSPCPNVFSYEPSASELGRWYGTVHLSTDSVLHSLWLNIVLDNKADIVGNWIGDVSTQDNIDFKIENTNMQLNPGPAVVVRFFVQYNKLEPVPRLLAIRLNGRDICNANSPQPVTPGSPNEQGSGQTTKKLWTDIDITSPRTQPTRPPQRIRPVVRPAEQRPVDTTSFNRNPNPSKIDDSDFFQGGIPTFVIPDSSSNSNRHNEQQHQCGQVRLNANPLVVNGSPTLAGQWPWQIALYQTQTVDNKYICGGTLVTRRHVITAAHCVTRRSSKRVVDPNTLTIYLGKHNLRTSVDGVQIKFVQSILIHPQYNESNFAKDLAILELKEPVTYSDWVQPACLWPENKIDLRNVIAQKGSVVGWGFDDSGVATEELNLVEMPVVNTETCIRSYSEFFVRFTSNYTYCAGYRDGNVQERTGQKKRTSVCNGDSGGGMVFKMGNSWYLRGLVSLSVARQNEFRCDPTHYVIFTDIAKFLPWITENVYDY